MNKYIFNIIVFGFFFCFAANAQPKLEIVGGDSYNWSKVYPRQSPLKATVELKNTGNQKLLINHVRPSCGCTAVLLDKKELEPGEIAKLDVKLNITARSGSVVKTVFIETNDPVNPNVNLYLKAEVQVDIELTPSQYFNFDELKLGKESTSKLILKNNSEQTVSFADVSVAPDYVTVNLPKEFSLKPHEEYEIVAKVTPINKGYFGCVLKMRTSNPEYPEISIQGSAVVSDTKEIKNGNK